MKVTEIGEFGLIKVIEALAAQAAKGEGVIRGIGDDVALIRSAPGKVILLTTDLLLEDIHFTLAHTGPLALGKKALGVNLSDIAACGGAPTAFLVSLALPAETEVDFITALYEGMREQAKGFSCSLVGGDTSRGEKVMISITLIGEAEEGKVVFRHGAKEGDLVFVTGQLGDSALGLEQLRRGEKEGSLIERLLDPAPRVKEGREIARQGLATAMIDISDGLIADLGHMLEASKVGAQIYISQLPLSEEYRKQIGTYQSDRYLFALTGGEDYELLFTASPEKEGGVGKLAQAMGIPMTLIGEITEASAGLKVMDGDGKEYRIEQKGYDHFKT
jgi:thiamine-monophosphate kinase